MNRMLTVVSDCFCLIVCFSCPQFAHAQELPRGNDIEFGGAVIEQEEKFDVSGTWQLEWDDAIDGEMSKTTKKCNIQFSMTGSDFKGNFIGRVAGTFRDAKLTGKIVHRNVPLIQFVQSEANYSCAYQIYWNPSANHTPRGVWHDSNGASGEFTLLKMQ